MLKPQSLQVKRTIAPSKAMIQKLIDHIVDWVIFIWYWSPAFLLFLPHSPSGCGMGPRLRNDLAGPSHPPWSQFSFLSSVWLFWSGHYFGTGYAMEENSIKVIPITLSPGWKREVCFLVECEVWVLAILLHEETWSESKSINVKKTLSNGAQATLISNFTYWGIYQLSS